MCLCVCVLFLHVYMLHVVYIHITITILKETMHLGGMGRVGEKGRGCGIDTVHMYKVLKKLF